MTAAARQRNLISVLVCTCIRQLTNIRITKHVIFLPEALNGRLKSATPFSVLTEEFPSHDNKGLISPILRVQTVLKNRSLNVCLFL